MKGILTWENLKSKTGNRRIYLEEIHWILNYKKLFKSFSSQSIEEFSKHWSVIKSWKNITDFDNLWVAWLIPIVEFLNLYSPLLYVCHGTSFHFGDLILNLWSQSGRILSKVVVVGDNANVSLYLQEFTDMFMFCCNSCIPNPCFLNFWWFE